MKQFFSRKLNIRLCLVFLLVSLFFVIHSCKKDASHSPATDVKQVSPDDKLVTDAKTYFEKYVTPTTGTAVDQSLSGNNIKTLRQSIVKTAAWAKAYTQTFDFGKGVIVPITYAQDLYIHIGNHSLPLSALTWLFMYTGNDNKMHTELVTKIPDADDLNSTDSTRAYTGILYVEDFFGNFIKGYKYLSNGTVQDISAPTKVVKSNSGLVVQDVTCSWTDYYTCTSSGGNNYGCTYDNSSEVVCVENEGGASGGAGSGGGATSTVYQYIGGGGGSGGAGNPGAGGVGNPGCPPVVNESLNSNSYTVNTVPCNIPNPPPVVIAKVINDLTDPCLKTVLNKLINNNLNGQIANIINDVFGSSDKVNLTFVENDSTTPTQTAPPVITGNNIYNETITINLAQVNGSSQEYKAIIMIHEILHAYMNYNNGANQTQLQQHQVMAQRYVGDMKAFVQSLYPTLSDANAYSIILNGMADVYQNNATAYQALLNSYNTSQANYELEKAGLAGTPCSN